MKVRVTCLLGLLEPRMTIEEDASKTTESALASDHAMMSPVEPMTVNGDNLEADEEGVFGAAILGATVVEAQALIEEIEAQALIVIVAQASIVIAARDSIVIEAQDLIVIVEIEAQASIVIEEIVIEARALVQALIAIEGQALVIAIEGRALVIALEVEALTKIEGNNGGVEMTKKVGLVVVKASLEIAVKADLVIDAKEDSEDAVVDLVQQAIALLNTARFN